jgi:AraC-like DNA-binding protein
MVDTLSDVLRAVRLTGAIFYTLQPRAPWSIQSVKAITMGPLIRPGVDHVIAFHALLSGSCYGSMNGEQPITVGEGDVIVFPQGDVHVLCSQPGLRATPFEPDLDTSRRPVWPVSVGNRDGASARIVCGYLGCDAGPFKHLIGGLPRLLHVPRSAQKDSIIAHFMTLAAAESESPSPGRETVLARLSELMFVEALRRYIASLPEDRRGWLSGLRDPIVGKALAALHERPAQPWTLEDLASVVGTSRSVLAERFTELVAVPPMHYLQEWRMQLCAELLSTTSASLAEIAERVGYGSEAALSRAFKRLVGVAPGRWRDGERTASTPRGQGSEVRG